MMTPNKPTGETMSEGSDMMEESSETISAPVAALAGAAVGDTVTFTVKSIDGDTATLYPVENESTEPKGSAISQAAKLFDEGE